MRSELFIKAKLVAWVRAKFNAIGLVGLLALGLSVVVGSLGIAEAAVRAHGRHHAAPKPPPVLLVARPAPSTHLDIAPWPAWVGLDVDGDGAPDFANPTGGAPRGHDRFGSGYFHASRDGGARAHEGVDYDSTAGQEVVAPISGFVSRIGYAYPGDERYRYVEIDNPALRLQARIFYVDPQVRVGESVEVGRPIGTAYSLQPRYPGITDHVHLEIEDRGRKIDAQRVIVARGASAGVMTAMN